MRQRLSSFVNRRTPARAFLTACAALALTTAACGGSGPAAAKQSATQPAAAQAADARTAQSRPVDAGSARDLAVDEQMGGHTLARHVGRTDEQLEERLRRERQISAASTYTDRPSAERAVGAALTASARQLDVWARRSGRRPNLVLHYTDRGRQPLGRSLTRGQRRPVPAFRALVVLRWDDDVRRFFVLTSYPEADR